MSRAGRDTHTSITPERGRALSIAKDKMIDFISQQGLAKTAMELYAEEELERRVGRFFDVLIIHMVRGYEAAWRRAAHTTS